MRGEYGRHLHVALVNIPSCGHCSHALVAAAKTAATKRIENCMLERFEFGSNIKPEARYLYKYFHFKVAWHRDWPRSAYTKMISTFLFPSDYKSQGIGLSNVWILYMATPVSLWNHASCSLKRLARRLACHVQNIGQRARRDREGLARERLG